MNNLSLINPSFVSPIIGKIMSLEHLRKESFRLRGSTPPSFFFQIRDIFHWMESLGSARIEGNHTTLSEYADIRIARRASPPVDPIQNEEILEIENIQRGMQYIETVINEGSKEPITHAFIRELHQLTVNDLSSPEQGGEGDNNPGHYRAVDVSISGSKHTPPHFLSVQGYMDDLLNFINKDDEPQYDLIKIAQAHHRFCWIHPFKNGNGRVVRLLTYALLIRFGFSVKKGILNPTAVFCTNRNTYYKMLEIADVGTSDSAEEWCLYVLSGFESQIEKLTRLTKQDYIRDKILLPALNFCTEKGMISPLQLKILTSCAENTNGIITSKDLGSILQPRQRTYQLKKLVDEQILKPTRNASRQYTLNLTDSVLVRGVLHSLRKEGFGVDLDNHSIS